jgi:hypothetical protein
VKGSLKNRKQLSVILGGQTLARLGVAKNLYMLQVDSSVAEFIPLKAGLPQNDTLAFSTRPEAFQPWNTNGKQR